MVDWLQTIATAFISAGTAYGVASGRVVREESAKLRASERNSLPDILSDWLAEAEAIRRGISIGIEAYGSPVDELYKGYIQCSLLVRNTRKLSAWERYLVKTFCISAFGRQVYDMALRIPAKNEDQPKIADSLIDYKLVAGGEVMESAFTRANVVLGIFDTGDWSRQGYLSVENGLIPLMRMPKRNSDRHSNQERSETQAQEVADQVVKLCSTYQYPKLRLLAAVTFKAARAKFVRKRG